MTPRALWLAVAAVIAMTGCSSTSKPTVVPPLPSESVSPTATGVPAVVSAEPLVPIAARAATPAAASAFVKYWFGHLDGLFRLGHRFDLQALSGSGCNSCRNFGATVDAFAKLDHHIAGPSFTNLLAATPALRGGVAYVGFTADLPARREVTATGKVVHAYPAGPRLRLVVVLERRGEGWRIRGMRQDGA